jgi:hypothetical protein
MSMSAFCLAVFHMFSELLFRADRQSGPDSHFVANCPEVVKDWLE